MGDVSRVRNQDAPGDESVGFHLSNDVIEDLLKHFVSLKTSGRPG